MSEPWAEIPAICEIHGGPGRVVLRRESDRVVLDGQIDHCCLLTLEPSAVTLMFDVLGEWLG